MSESRGKWCCDVYGEVDPPGLRAHCIPGPATLRLLQAPDQQRFMEAACRKMRSSSEGPKYFSFRTLQQRHLSGDGYLLRSRGYCKISLGPVTPCYTQDHAGQQLQNFLHSRWGICIHWLYKSTCKPLNGVTFIIATDPDLIVYLWWFKFIRCLSKRKTVVWTVLQLVWWGRGQLYFISKLEIICSVFALTLNFF